MNDWKSSLEGLNKDLRAKEEAEHAKKAATLTAFRKLLKQLEPVMASAAEFGDAFGVDCAHEVSRFDDRYPWLKFRILKPVLMYEVVCKDGVLHDSLKEGTGAAKAGLTTLEALEPRKFEQLITQWVQAAANANRKVPGKR